MYGAERHDHIQCWIFAIDTHSVLCGGKGDFAVSMLRNDALSSPIRHQQILDSRESPFAEESGSDRGRSLLDFHRAILTVAARLGLLARELRAEYSQSYLRHQGQARHVETVQRQQRVMQLQDTLRRTWKARLPYFIAKGFSNKSVPVKARGIFEHVSQTLPPTSPGYSAKIHSLTITL